MKLRRVISYLGVLPLALLFLLLSGAASVDTKALSGGSATVFDDSREAFSQASPVMDQDNLATFIHRGVTCSVSHG